MPPPRPSVLTDADLRVLRALADGAGDALVADRAGIVLAEHHRRRGGGAASPGVPRQTAAKWYRRFAEHGADGLRDLPRSGRPATRDEDAARAVLVAPLLMPSVRWTSHDVAAVTGRSQAAVVRTWRRAYGRATRPSGMLPASGLALVAVRVDAAGGLVVLAERGTQVPAGGGPFMRSPRRAPLQVLLAADLLAAGGPGRGDGAVDGAVESADGVDGTPGKDGADDAAARSFVETARRRTGGRAVLHVLTRRPLRPAPDGVVEHVVPTPDGWQALLEPLVRGCTATPPDRLVHLQQRLMAWAAAPDGPFEWVADQVPGATDRRAAARPVPRPTGQVVADAVLAAILERITTGRLAAGDRVTETSLARAAHASRGHVREALLALASNGLVDLEPRRGARVPAPQVADVVETYAVRRALGALVVRRAVHWTPGSLDGADRALAVLVATGETGDAWATGEADIAFQDALAESTGMRRVPGMFVALSAQIRVFTAVLGVRYAYSIPAMVEDDTTLLRHVRARDEAQALATWHAKMDAALGYMVARLGAVPDLRR